MPSQGLAKLKLMYPTVTQRYSPFILQKRKATALKPSKSGTSGKEDESDDDVQVVNLTSINKGGRDGAKAAWAFKQFQPVPAVKGELVVWLWKCKWCL